MKYDEEAGHERNINNMTQEDDYKSPWEYKDATTVNDKVNDTAHTFLNEWNDEISDLTEQVETSKEPIKETQTSAEPITDTNMVDRVRKQSVGTTNVDPVVTGVGIIGQGVPRAISGEVSPKALFTRGEV